MSKYVTYVGPNEFLYAYPNYVIYSDWKELKRQRDRERYAKNKDEISSR